MNLARPVRREDDDRRLGCANGAELGDRHLVIGEQLEEKPLELLVGAIELVDEEHGNPSALVLKGAQQRPLDEKRFGEQLLGGPNAIELVAGLEEADLEELARVVPLVQGVADVEPLVTLEADEIGFERGRQGFRDFGLAHAGFAFEKQRPLELQREVDRHHEAAIGHIHPGRPAAARARRPTPGGSRYDARWNAAASARLT